MNSAGSSTRSQRDLEVKRDGCASSERSMSGSATISPRAWLLQTMRMIVIRTRKMAMAMAMAWHECLLGLRRMWRSWVSGSSWWLSTARRVREMACLDLRMFFRRGFHTLLRDSWCGTYFKGQRSLETLGACVHTFIGSVNKIL